MQLQPRMRHLRGWLLSLSKGHLSMDPRVGGKLTISFETFERCGGCIINEQSLVTSGPRETLVGEMTELRSLPSWPLGCVLYQTGSHEVPAFDENRARAYPLGLTS